MTDPAHARAAASEPIGDASWVNISDPASPVLDEIAAREGFHPLDIEDCRHRNQIAKVMEHEGYTFIVFKILTFDSKNLDLQFDDFDVFITAKGVVTVEELDGATIVQRAASRVQAAHAQKPWRIVHAIVDVAVDDYLPALDAISDLIDDLETTVLQKPSPAALHRALGLKRALIEFRRNATAMREVVNHLLRTAPKDRSIYLRDVYDHLVRIIDFIETYRDLVSGSLDIYLSSIANRTNDIVKVLTIYGTVALPLIVLTGFYGMNIDLPFQHSPHAFLIVSSAMILSTVGIIFYFWRRGWL